jgi:hydroxymethylpyrimidine/phosphomethylpyrimidine kinase
VSRAQRPRVVAIGGWYPSGRAGVLADVATIRAAGAEAAAVVTCITAQGARPRSTPVEPKLVVAQLEAVSDSGPIHAVKLGVIPDRVLLDVIARWLGDTPAVLDPVTVSSKGLTLSTLTPRDFAVLARKTVVLTPNRDEHAALQGLRGFGAVVVKSFAPGTDAVFLDPTRAPILLKAGALKRSPHHRGTGCRFASRLAVELAKEHTVAHAARAAQRAVRKFLSVPILRQV